MLRVDGHLSGRVSSADGTLIVSTGGQVDANIDVSVAQIYGTVNGDIIASKRIELGRVAHVTGNIQAPALVIENGAIFEGSCRMQQVRDAQARDETRASAGPSASSGAAPKGDGRTGDAVPAATAPAANPVAERPGANASPGAPKPAPATT